MIDTERKAYQFVIPQDISELTPNKRHHWRVKALYAKAARELATISWLEAGKPRIDCPVAVRVLVERPRLVDYDNALAACKSTLDGVLSGNLLPDDSPRYVRALTIEQRKAAYHRVTITVIELQDVKGGGSYDVPTAA